MSLIESLTVIYNLLVLITLIVLVWQGILQRRLSHMTALEATYSRYIDFDRLAVEHPSLQLYSVRSDVYEAVATLSDDELRKRAYIELILDSHELMFLKQRRGYYRFQEDYLRSLLSNPHVRKYWNTMRGNYRDEFAKEINALLKTAPAPTSEA